MLREPAEPLYQSTEVRILQARNRHKDAAIKTLAKNLKEAIEQRDAAHKRLAYAKTKTQAFVEVWKSGRGGREADAHREAEMDELVNAYMDEEGHWFNDYRDEAEEDGDE